MAGPEFIYVMKGLTKVVPPSRVILKDIWLSFYPGAKIGVVGPNGSGKSSLLRVMAGVGKDFNRGGWGVWGGLGWARGNESGGVGLLKKKNIFMTMVIYFSSVSAER